MSFQKICSKSAASISTRNIHGSSTKSLVFHLHIPDPETPLWGFQPPADMGTFDGDLVPGQNWDGNVMKCENSPFRAKKMLLYWWGVVIGGGGCEWIITDMNKKERGLKFDGVHGFVVPIWIYTTSGHPANASDNISRLIFLWGSHCWRAQMSAHFTNSIRGEKL